MDRVSPGSTNNDQRENYMKTNSEQGPKTERIDRSEILKAYIQAEREALQAIQQSIIEDES